MIDGAEGRITGTRYNRPRHGRQSQNKNRERKNLATYIPDAMGRSEGLRLSNQDQYRTYGVQWTRQREERDPDVLCDRALQPCSAESTFYEKAYIIK